MAKLKEYTGTGASGGNATDGNDIPSPRPFKDDEAEIDNYLEKNFYGGEGNHYNKDIAQPNPNRTKFTKFENMKISEEDALVARGKKLHQAIINVDKKAGNNFYKNLFKTQTNKEFPKRLDTSDGNMLAALNKFAADLKRKGGRRFSEGEKEDAIAQKAALDAAAARKKAAELELKASQEAEKETQMQKEDQNLDSEGRMAKSQIFKMANYATKLTQMLDDKTQLPSWVQSKLTKASDYISAAYHYLDYEFTRQNSDLMEHIDNHKKQAKRAILMEGAMKKFFEDFDNGKTNEEIIQDYASRGTQVPEAFVSNARRQYEGYKKLKLELEMSEKEFKNSAKDIVNNPKEGDIGMEPREEKQLASGLFNEKLDPVGQEDDDIDNDGDVDKTDKYLKNRRKAVSKAINKTKK